MSHRQPEDYLILVADDVSQNLQLVAEILEKFGYETTFATNGKQAIERAQSAKPDLILLDLMMPDMNGLEVCEQLKSNPLLADIPVIFITVHDDKDYLLAAFERGAVDYVTKPFYPPELLARVKTHLELKCTRDRLQKLLLEKEKLTQELEILATTDPLTGIWNRRQFLHLAKQELHHAYRYERQFSVLMLDIDRFKLINDTYGHATGDIVLKCMVKTICNSLRKADFLGRIGGEEFVVFLPETNLEQALNVADYLRETLANLDILVDGKHIKITVSIGVATYQSKEQPIDAILSQADQALYQAKNQGRNRVISLCPSS